MKRRIIEIDEEKCTGCGLCAEACHEGAIAMMNGKARLIRDDYCDGFGDCLPACPVDAISFVEREAAPYDEAAVLAAKQAREAKQGIAAFAECPGSAPRDLRAAGCSGSISRDLRPSECPGSASRDLRPAAQGVTEGETRPEEAAVSPAPASELGNWPIQIKLALTSAPYFNGTDLLIAADCTAFAYGDFHATFMRGKTVLIGCPKLDAVDYSEKLSAILASNDIKSITVARMEVPCCAGLERATRSAIEAAGSELPLNVITIGIDGSIKS